jgi:hypothetical protein
MPIHSILSQIRLAVVLHLEPPHGFTQGLDVPDERLRAPFQQIEGKEIGTARYPVAAIVWPKAMLPPPCTWRNTRSE